VGVMVDPYTLSMPLEYSKECFLIDSQVDGHELEQLSRHMQSLTSTCQVSPCNDQISERESTGFHGVLSHQHPWGMSIFLNVEGFVGQKSIAPFLNWPCDEEQQICPVQLLLLWKEKVVAKPLQAIGWDRHGLLLQRESEEFRDVSLDLLQQPCIHPMVHKLQKLHISEDHLLLLQSN
jgi:hypothetical protein